MVETYFENIRARIITELNSAKESILVAVYWFTNRDLFQLLLQKLKDGVIVELIIHNDYINNRGTGLDFQSFIDRGGKFYFSSTEYPMHNKFCVIDNSVLINGSYNWTYYAESKNRENIIILKNEQNIVNEFVSEFNRIQSQLQQVEKVVTMTGNTITQDNPYSIKQYLANDLLYEARETGNTKTANEALNLVPENLEIQKKAVEWSLAKQYVLSRTIGVGVIYDQYKVILEKGTLIPTTVSGVLQTTDDNQLNVICKVYVGENTYAKANIHFRTLELRVPAKPKGEAKVKYTFTIDIFGKLHMYIQSQDTGKSDYASISVKKILEIAT